MEVDMNWNVIKGGWTQRSGNQRQPWGYVAEELLEFVAGENDALSSEIQEAYGISKEEAETQVSPF